MATAAASLGVDFYWEVLGPRELDEPVAGSLSDDVVDIYRDLRRGLAVADTDIQGVGVAARLLLALGNHATSAFRMLHSVVAD